ncbi:hypothetical protein K9M47_01455 [Candidatus Gracilibacteria bacterium]|nr:hypothetical protein [Candidatus Gracilibacteria bacterium]MCF7898963.1 hypothetical protein [Candidatus Paceibacterota bacterium]
MKTKNQKIGAVLVTLGVVGASLGSVYAYKGNPEVRGPNYSPERHEAMTKAFATNDYNAWKSLMGEKGNVTKVVNKDNFAKFAEAHSLMEQGKTVEAQKLRQELGLGMNNGSGKAVGKGMGKGVHR